MSLLINFIYIFYMIYINMVHLVWIHVIRLPSSRSWDLNRSLESRLKWKKYTYKLQKHYNYLCSNDSLASLVIYYHRHRRGEEHVENELLFFTVSQYMMQSTGTTHVLETQQAYRFQLCPVQKRVVQNSGQLSELH